MTFQVGTGHSFKALQHVGIAIQRNDRGQNHIGFLYRIDEDTIKFCHLAWHFDFKNDPVQTLTEGQPPYFWDEMASLDDFDGQIFTAGLLRLVKTAPQIPYSITYTGAPFHHDGTYNPLSEEGEGLTCATFMIAFSDALGFPILTPETWQVRQSDKDWQNSILEILRKHSTATPEHVTAAQDFVGAMRFRPEEVAVCAVDENPPLDFDTAVPLATELNVLLAE